MVVEKVTGMDLGLAGDLTVICLLGSAPDGLMSLVHVGSTTLHVLL